MRDLGRLADVVGALFCVGAGIYLLGHHSPPLTVAGAEGQSWFEILAHGIGAYFIGKGILLFRSTYLQDRVAASLEELIRGLIVHDESES